MQALGKEGAGGDHVSVKVKLPSGVEKAPLGGENVYTGVPRKFQKFYGRPLLNAAVQLMVVKFE